MINEHFDKNEIYLIILLVAFFAAVLFFPKKLKPHIAVFGLLWGIMVGTIFDFTLGGGLMDFYKVNDSNHYELFDVLYYLLFAPFGYFFIYFYEVFQIRKYAFLIYILAWSVFGVLMQWGFIAMGIISLQRGYQISYSLIVFLVTQTVTGLYIEILKRKEQLTK
ncbi:hypothetical protein ABWW58_06155 [Sporolactobacillus sp. STCC-11]|uniref:hypothetical protein n=1 Tax=Sporolactobacillus caesalpiniae TaxID=3230362 RepID=UPI003395DDBF